MPTPNYPLAGNTLTNLELKKRLGGKGPLYEFMSNYALGSTVNFVDDFALAALDLSSWTVATAGGTATTWAITVAANGLLRAVAGTTAATSGNRATTPKIWTGANNMGCEVRFKTSDITETRIEIGFIDVVPAASTSTPVVNSLVTPTFNTTADAAVYVYNHTGSTTTSGLYAIDSTATTGDAEKATWTTNRPVNATFQTVRITLQGAVASCWIDGVKLGVISSAIKPTTTTCFQMSTLANSTTSQNLDVDYVRVWSDRA